MDMRLDNQLSAEIERIVREELTAADVEIVETHADIDADDNPVLRITIVFRDRRPFDVKRAKGLVRHLRPVLEAAHTDEFPILSFLSQSDHKRLLAAH
jgi:hypothetical protein